LQVWRAALSKFLYLLCYWDVLGAPRAAESEILPQIVVRIWQDIHTGEMLLQSEFDMKDRLTPAN